MTLTCIVNFVVNYFEPNYFVNLVVNYAEHCPLRIAGTIPIMLKGSEDHVVEIVACILSGAAIGFLIGLTGVGGGVLAIPTLILVVGLEPIAAVGTTSLYAVLTKAYAGFRHYRQGTVNVQAGVKFLAAALPGVVCSSLFVKWGKASLSPSGVETLQNAIGALIIWSMALSIVALLMKYNRLRNDFFLSGAGRMAGLLCTFLVGAVMGATSVGGGVLIIPALLLFHRETSKYVGTSIFIAVLSMLAMSVIYAFAGGHGRFSDVNVRVAGLMALGALVGTHHGSALSGKLDPRRLQFIVVAVVLLAIGMMLVSRML